jgi:predicted acyl esterase
MPRSAGNRRQHEWSAVIVTTFPKAVRIIEHTLIPLKDGAALAARIWLPDDAEQNPVPAILEYLPYRKGDGTYERDALTHPYLAGHGYAGVRVDLRGTGESTGLLFDEYAKQEQDDGSSALVQWLGWDDGNFLGRVQWTSNCGAPSPGTQSNRNHLFERRSVR